MCLGALTFCFRIRVPLSVSVYVSVSFAVVRPHGDRPLVVLVAADVEPVPVEAIGADRLACTEKRLHEIGEVEVLALGMCSSASGSIT